MEIQLTHALHSWNMEIQLMYKNAVRTGVEMVVMEIQPHATRGVSAMVGRLCIICPPKGDYIYNHPHAAELPVIQLENQKGVLGAIDGVGVQKYIDTSARAWYNSSG